MAQTRTYPRNGEPHSRTFLRRQSGIRGTPLERFLDRFAHRNVVHHFDDFDGDAINLDYYAVANSGGTSAADFAHVAAAGGIIQSDTGTDDNGSCSIIGPAIYLGDYYAWLEIGMKIDAVTGLNFEAGFAAAVPGANAGVITDIDTPAIADDSAVVSVDTDQTLVTAAFVTGGTSFTDTKTNAAGVPGWTGGNLPVADTFFAVRIQLEGNSASCWINGHLIAEHRGSYVEGGTLLAPWVYTRTRNTTAKFTSLDYLAVGMDRAW